MFLTMKAQASREPGSDFWYNPIAGSGDYLTGESALRLATVYGCVRVLAESVAQLPLIVYRRLPGGGKERATSHPAYSALALRPNPNQTRFEWMEQKVAWLCLSGNAYDEPVLRGNMLEIYPVHPNNVTITALNGGMRRYTVRENGTQRVVPQGSLVHYRALSIDGITGVGPVQYERETLSFARATQKFGSSYFKNNGRPGGVIQYPGSFKDKDAREKFRAQWQASQSGDNFGKVGLLEFGMTYHETKLTNEDAKFIEARKYSDIEICRIFRVPPHKVANLDNATFSNIEHQSLEFVTDTLMPWLVRIESALNVALFEPGSEFFCEFLVDGLLRGDSKTRHESYAIGIQNGYMTRNEARIRENMNPLDGLDTPLEPLNMTAPRSNDGAVVDNSNVDTEVSRMARAFIGTIVDRECDQLAKAPSDATFSEFCIWWSARFKNVASQVTSVLGVSESAAVKYVAEGPEKFWSVAACIGSREQAIVQWRSLRAEQLGNLYANV